LNKIEHFQRSQHERPKRGFVLRQRRLSAVCKHFFQCRLGYLAHCVARKFFQHKETAGEAYERFKQEIKATKRVGDISDSCVRVHECGQYEVSGGPSVPFFAMEYVPGLSLEDLILLKETPFTPHEIYVIASQIAAALEEIGTLLELKGEN